MAQSGLFLPAPRQQPALFGRDLSGLLRLTAVYAVAALAAWLLFGPLRGMTVALWPAGGLVLGLAWRERQPLGAVALLALAVADLAVALLFVPWSPTLLPLALLRAAAPLMAQRALGREATDVAALDCVQRYLAFLLRAAFPQAALLALATALLVGRDVALTAFGAHLLGMMLFTPLLAADSRRLAGMLRSPMALTEGAALILGIAGGTVLLFLQSALALIALVAPLLLWAALRHGFWVTGLLGALAASIAMLATLEGLVPTPLLRGVPPESIVPALQGYLVLVTGMSAVIAVAVSRERKMAAAALARSQELEGLLRALPDPVFRLDHDGRILDFRAALPLAMPFPPERFLGQRLGNLLPAAIAARLRRAMREAESTPGAVQLECELGEAGKTGVFEIRIASLPDRRFVAVLRDITERKRAEQALAARAEALARSNEELQQFAYVASHDLQEPLRTVASFCELLRRRYHGKLDAEADEFIDFAVDGARRMQSLIRDLLDLSRITTRGRPFVAVDANALLEEALKGLGTAIEEAGARIEFAGLPTLRGDPAQLVQLFANLLGNAIKYRSEQTPRITVGAEREGEGWRFCVADNGIGIEEEFQGRIFQIFQRLHTREEYGGNGIGLALCRKIVARHGGRIWVESRKGEGSRFFVWLPDRPPSTDELAGAASPPAEARSTHMPEEAPPAAVEPVGTESPRSPPVIEPVG